MNAAIDVRLGSKVNDRIDIVFERRQHRVAIANVAMHEMMTGFINAFEVLEIACVSKRVKLDYGAGRQFGERQPHKSRTDKSGTTGDEEFCWNYAQTSMNCC